MKKVFAIVAMAMLSIAPMRAQKHFTVYGSGVLPTGSFADSDLDFKSNGTEWGLMSDEEEGGAGFGLGLGLRWHYELPKAKGLSVVLSADAFLNFTNSNVNEYFEDMIDEVEKATTVTELTITKPRYLNVPLMVGMQYATPLGESMSLCFDGGLGLNIRTITESEQVEKGYTVDPMDPSTRYNYTSTETSTFETITTFAYRAGAHLNLSDKYVLGIEFYNLGKGRVKGDDKSVLTNASGRTTDKQTFKYKSITPTMLVFRVGYMF